MRLFAGFTLLLLTACPDACSSQFSALGDQGIVACYSGGVLIYEGKSTGKILSENGSDGWFFRDAATGRLVRVSGDCIIRN